jgi:hypothetical protein
MKSETNTPEKRLRILGDDEIEALYGRPRFTDEERVQAFALAQEERALLQELRSLRSQTYFILQLGYFKAKRLFFMFDLQETAEDVQYIRGQYFPIYVFRELMQYLTEQRIVAPGYSFMQTTVGKALTYEQNRLITLVQTHLTTAERETLKHLLGDAQGLHTITLLKREP